jgi:hypothetical protein
MGMIHTYAGREFMARVKSGSIDIHVDRFGPDLIDSPSSVGVFGAGIAA